MISMEKDEERRPSIDPSSTATRGQSFSRPTRIVAKKASNILAIDNIASDGGEGMFVKQPMDFSTKKPKSVSTRNAQAAAVRGQRLSEYEEDVGRNQSRQFLVSTKRSKAKNREQLSKDIRAFKKHVEDEQEILESLASRVNHSLLSNLASTSDHFQAVYNPILLNNHSSEGLALHLPGHTDAHSESLYKQCKKLLSEPSNLIEKYEGVEVELQALRKDVLPGFGVEGTLEEMVYLLDAGRQLGLSKIEIGVFGNSSAGDRTHSKFDSNLYANGNEAAGVWGKVAWKQERAFKKVVAAVDIQ